MEEDKQEKGKVVTYLCILYGAHGRFIAIPVLIYILLLVMLVITITIDKGFPPFFWSEMGLLALLLAAYITLQVRLAGEEQHKRTWIAIASKVIGCITILFSLFVGFLFWVLACWHPDYWFCGW